MERDVVIAGAGHNGLVCALFLARSGLDVLVVEERDVIGGGCRTEKPFANGAPDLAVSTGAPLLGLVPPELVRKMGVELPLKRREPHLFVPTVESRYLLLGADEETTRQPF